MLKITRFHICLLFVVVALFVRVGFVFFVSPHLDRSDISSIDGQAYHQIAQNLVQRRLFTSVLDPPYHPDLPGTFRPPLTPFYLAFWYWIFDSDIFWGRLALALISAVSCGLTFYVGQKIFGVTIGVVAGCISLFYPFLLLLVHLPLTEGLSLCLSLALLGLLYSSYQKPKTFTHAFVVGVVLGLLLLNKAANITVLSCILLWSFSPHFRSLKNAAVNMGFVLVFAAITILPWSVRNYSVTGSVIPINSNGGWTFYLGNNPYTDTNLEALEQGRANGWIPPKEVFGPFSDLNFNDTAAWEARSVRLALEFMLADQRQFLQLAFRKLKIFWSPYNHIVDKITWIPLLCFSLLGICSTFRSWRQHMLLYTLIVSAMCIPLFFTSMPRFRAPLLPFIMMYASAGLVQLYTLGRQMLRANRN